MSTLGKEGWGVDKDRFTCRHCLRLLPRKAFADQVTKGKIGKYGSQRYKRFCVQCGLKHRYSPGSRISRQGEHFVVCVLPRVQERCCGGEHRVECMRALPCSRDRKGHGGAHSEFYSSLDQASRKASSGGP